MTFNNLEFTITGNTFILIALLLFVLLYSYYIYKYTVPPTSAITKFFLILTRISALTLIVIMLFEPLVTLNYSEKIEPDNILFIDNSSSIVHKDSSRRAAKIKRFISDYKQKVPGNIKIALFGKDVKPVNADKEVVLDFTEQATNFDKLIPYIQKDKNKIASVTIVSDGIITDGSNSTSRFEKLGIPIFTVAVGDSVKTSDVAVKKVEFNKVLFRNNPTEIKAIISNSDFGGKNIVVSLIGNSGIIEQQQVKLNNSGINIVKFNFTPKKKGKNYLTVKINKLTKEETYANNLYHFVLDVLNDKIKVLVVAGAPSPDLEMLCQSIQENNHVKYDKIIQIAPEKFEDNLTFADKIDSVDLLVLLDFPSSKTPRNLVEDVARSINKGIPYFLFITAQTDLRQLGKFNNQLSFSIKKYSDNQHPTQVTAFKKGLGIINDVEKWENLPPIARNNSIFHLKRGTTVLLTDNNNAELPVLFVQKIASLRRIVFIGSNFWRWRLNHDDNLVVFDSFIYNSLKWLSLKKDKTVFIKTTKDIFNPNEAVGFIANIYDETLTPVNNASVDIEIYSGNYRKAVKLNPDYNGLYTGEIDILKSGKFNYKAVISIPERKKQIIKGTFRISDINVENISFVLNSNYLKLLSNITSGISFNVEDYSKLFTYIKQVTIIEKNDRIISKRLELWKSNWILFIIILFLSFEWIIRKKKGML